MHVLELLVGVRESVYSVHYIYYGCHLAGLVWDVKVKTFDHVVFGHGVDGQFPHLCSFVASS